MYIFGVKIFVYIASMILAGQNTFSSGKSPLVNSSDAPELIGELSGLGWRLALVILADFTRRHGFVKRDGCPLSARRLSAQHHLRRLFDHGRLRKVRRAATVMGRSAGGNGLKSGFFCSFLKVVLHCTFKPIHCWVFSLGPPGTC